MADAFVSIPPSEGADGALPMCVVIGDKDAALTNFLTKFCQLAEVMNSPTWSVEWWTGDFLKNPNPARALDDGDAWRRQDKLVRWLVQAPVCIVDTRGGAASSLLLGARLALSDQLTLFVYSGTRPDLDLYACRWDGVDLAAPDWTSLRRKLEAFDDLRTRRWSNPFRSPNALKISVSPQRLRADGQIITRLTPSDNSISSVTKFWRRKSGEPALGITHGDIAKVSGVPVWLNSENIDMQMARVADMSVSAQIRARASHWRGARGEIADDWLFFDLAYEMGTKTRVELGDVLLTKVRPGTALYDDNKVRLVAHVASVEPAGEGAEGAGSKYRPGPDLGKYVSNALEKIEEHAASDRSVFEKNEKNIQILTPLFGAGDAGLSSALAASLMVSGFSSWLDKKRTKPSVIGALIFVAFDVQTRDSIRGALKAHEFSESSE